MMQELPIHAVLSELLGALRAAPNAVLVAPPGAGKTTAVAPALLAEPWCDGQILLLSPRRLAARAAAERMAALAGEPVGRTIGYATRLDAKQSAATRVLVLTEGIFRNRVLADPELAGISAVLFDEVHERSLDSDFGLALARDAQALRPDLRLVAMSATLDGARFARLLGDAPVIESAGRAHPLDLRHIGRANEQRIEDAMAAAIRRALAEEPGGCLAFLPGVAEIERTVERLDRLPADVVLHRLHGSLDPAEQRAAIAPAAAGTRKLVLATSIAETSLTLDGVRIVVDSGLARRARYDRAAGITRLVTERASQAAVTQRAGRAARQAPGVAYRLWEEAATAGLPRFDPPEILEADLSALLLDCALWGVTDPATLAWLDPPPAAAVAEARSRLMTLGALDGDGRPTTHGRAIQRLPLPPRLAHMLVAAGARGFATLAGEVAALLSERGLGGSDADLDTRLQRWRRERGPRAEAARGLARRWAAMVSIRHPGERRDPEPGTSPPAALDSGVRRDDDQGSVAACVALAFPDRVSRRRGGDGADWVSIGGRGFRLDPAAPLARAQWLAVAEAQGAAAGARILSTAAIEEADVLALFADRVETRRSVRFDPATRGVQAVRERRLGAIRLASGPDDAANPAAIAAALVEGVRAHGPALLDWPDTTRALRARAAFAAAHGFDTADLSDEALLARLEDWLPPLVAGRRRLEQIPADALHQAILALIDWPQQRLLDRIAPTHFESAAGSRHPIDYEGDGAPAVELRPQTLFGRADHPMLADGRVPLLLRLTSPAGRPIQTTRDLPGFWSGSWAAVAREMRGRYPRHPWPDDPAAADPTLRTKKAAARGRA
ncbi:ATP-dependent helicase HrpB [Sphingomonas sp. 1P06PA]|uniref:ATP-dependent helicase HrpB n=1 Tax=Sphingomonas sp. 1P06PA TaxID=554121 RepID=UPI0039A6C767